MSIDMFTFRFEYSLFPILRFKEWEKISPFEIQMYPTELHGFSISLEDVKNIPSETIMEYGFEEEADILTEKLIFPNKTFIIMKSHVSKEDFKPFEQSVYNLFGLLHLAAISIPETHMKDSWREFFKEFSHHEILRIEGNKEQYITDGNEKVYFRYGVGGFILFSGVPNAIYTKYDLLSFQKYKEGKMNVVDTFLQYFKKQRLRLLMNTKTAP